MAVSLMRKEQYAI